MAATTRTFGDTIKGALIYAIGFIKVYDYSALVDGLIVALAARGVGIVCAETGVGLIPSTALRRPAFGQDRHNRHHEAIKNDPKVSTTANLSLWGFSNFSMKEQKLRPVIWMVYALAAGEHIVLVMERR